MSEERRVGPIEKAQEELLKIIINGLKEDKIPWVQPWDGPSVSPYNPISKTIYKNTNQLTLLINQYCYGYQDPRWCTFDQAISKGWKVRKGSKGTRIYFTHRVHGKTGEPLKAEMLVNLSIEEKSKLLSQYVVKSRSFHVYNGEQLEGLPKLSFEDKKGIVFEQEKVAQMTEKLIQDMNVKIIESGTKAFYSMSDDLVQMPERRLFLDEQFYYSTLYHELGHATGHEKRLRRDLSGRFGTKEYALEELRAEFSSALLSLDMGFKMGNEHVEQHKAYCQSWYEILTDHPEVLMSAIKDAHDIRKYILERAQIDQTIIAQEVEDEFSDKNIQRLERLLVDTKALKERVQVRDELERVKAKMTLLDWVEEKERLFAERNLDKERRAAQEVEWRLQGLNFGKQEDLIIGDKAKRFMQENISYSNKSFYRGERTKQEESNENTGLAFYGQGLYITSDKKYAEKFGDVKIIDPEFLPHHPAHFETQLDFEQFEYEIAAQYKLPRRYLYLSMDVSDLFQKLGYDGVTIGRGKDMIVVSYKDVAPQENLQTKESSEKIAGQDVDLTELKSSVSILDYAEEVLNLATVTTSGGLYQLVDHDSCKIYPNNTYYRFSSGRGGSVIDFAMEFGELSLPDAIESVKGYYLGHGPSNIKTTNTKQSTTFALPLKAADNKRVYAYLSKTRCIRPEIINEYIKRGLVFQEDGNANCVFVGKVGNEIHYAARRSSNSKASYKQDVPGSFPEVGVFFDNQSDTLVITESVIDQMSYQSLESNPKECSYLATNGTAKAIGVLKFHLIKRQGSELIKNVVIALDNDKPGEEAAEKISSFLDEQYPEINKYVVFPKQNDWNADLKYFVRGEVELQENIVNKQNKVSFEDLEMKES